MAFGGTNEAERHCFLPMTWWGDEIFLDKSEQPMRQARLVDLAPDGYTWLPGHTSPPSRTHLGRSLQTYISYQPLPLRSAVFMFR